MWGRDTKAISYSYPGRQRRRRVSFGFSAEVAAVGLAISAALVVGAAAEEPLATVVVTAPPISEAERRAPTSFVSIIDTEPHAEQVETAADALGEVAGVQVRRFGGLGAFSTVSIRGSEPNQVQVYLDGIPLSRARDEVVDLSDLPLDSLQRMEVYRGTTPVSFGAGAIGGVVNLVTKPPSATPSTQVTASYGSFNTRKLVAARSQRLGPVDFLGYLTYLGSQGDFSFADDNGTPLNPADDGRATRRNNDFNSLEALLEAAYRPSDHLRLDLTSETFFKDQGVPSIGSNQAIDSSLQKLRSLTYLRGTSEGLLDGHLDLSATAFGIYDRQHFQDPHGELFGVNEDSLNQTALIGGNTGGTWYLAESNAASWFAELSHEQFSPRNELTTPAALPDQNRLRLTTALQDQAGFFSERLLLVPTVRFEHIDDTVSASFTPAGLPEGGSVSRGRDLWSPSLGAQLRLGWGLALKGNIGRFERAPNFSELFGNRGFVRGNPALVPEKGINRDVGVTGSWEGVAGLDEVRFEYAYFDNDTDQLIVLVQTSQEFFRPLNIGAARVRGHELSLHGSWRKRVSIDANYTYQDAENRGLRPEHRGRQLPGRPRHELYVRPEIHGGWGRVYYELSVVSGNFLDLANFDEVPSRDIHTLGFAWNATAQLTLGLEARNITDNQISDLTGFPLPGRSFFGTATVRF